MCGILLEFVRAREVGVSSRNVVSRTFPHFSEASEADNIYKNPPPNFISPIFFVIFISLWGSTHDSVDCWSAHRSSAARDSFKREHD